MTEASSPSTIGVRADDLDPDLLALIQEEGPFVTVVLDTDPGIDNAADRFQRRWGPHRQELAGRGAPEDLLDQVGQALADARLGGPVVAVVASARGLVVLNGPEAGGDEVAEWDRLPRLGPVIQWHQSTPPALLVVIDRTGADVISGGRGDPVLETVAENDSPHLQRSQPGGWSQRRFQQRAENSWRAMAGEVADRLTEHVDSTDTRLIVVAGDERAVQQLRDQLPDRVGGLVRMASGGPGQGSAGDMEEDTRRWYRTAVAEDVVALLELFKQELGQRDLGVTGAAAVGAALNAAAVGTLLIHDDPADNTRVFVPTAGGIPLASDRASLEDIGLEPVPVRLVDAAILAAWATGAGVAVVPTVPELEDNVGAVLRYRPDADGPQ